MFDSFLFSGNPPAQGSAAAGSSTQQLDPSLAKQFYDDVYFDSDDSDMEEEKQAKKEKQGTGKCALQYKDCVVCSHT